MKREILGMGTHVGAHTNVCVYCEYHVTRGLDGVKKVFIRLT